MAVDHILHVGVDPDCPARLIREMRNYPGIRRALWALEHADRRAESPLETVGRYAFIRAGRRPPLSNVWIYGARRPYRVDHLIPECGIVLEGDGDIKYNNRADAAKIVRNEKRRHGQIEALDLSVIRYDMALARHHPGQLLHMVDRAVKLRRSRPAPDCWGLDPPSAMGRCAG